MTADPLNNTSVIDSAVCLCEAGGEDYLAAVAIGPGGDPHLVLAQRGSIGDDAVRYDPTCAAVAHEQTGSLPIEYARRITISRRQRGHRCGRKTKSGTVCRMRVAHAGDACDWHRTAREWSGQ